MANASENPLANQYKYIRLIGSRKALNVFFQNSDIYLASEIQGIGREFLQAVRVAARIDMPLVLNFQGVQQISSALIGKLVLLHKKARTEGVRLEFREMSTTVRGVVGEVMRIPHLDADQE